jgi:thiosulfate/3-mercaptopyruvate sulfurtransferase
MTDLSHPLHRSTRRSLFQSGATAGLMLAAAGLTGRQVSAQTSASNPAASPMPNVTDYPNPDLLVTAGWLREHIDQDDLIVVGLMPPSGFTTSHIPGSRQVDWPELEIVDTSPTSIDAWQAQISAIIGQLGITPTSSVIAYDDGTLFAARLWWVLHYLGHADVRVLDGGLAAWQEAGGEVEAGDPVLDPVGVYTGTPNPDVLAPYTEVLDSLDQPDVVIVDARMPNEWAAGHIPGAVNVPYTGNALPNPPAYWHPASALQEMYDAAGVTPDKLVIPYCFSGVKSAVTFFTLHLMGYERVALFTGSWNEWSQMPDAPIETGEG